MALTTCTVHEKAGHHVDEGRPEKVHKVRSQEEPGNQAGELVEQLVLWSSKYYGDKTDDNADCHMMKGHGVEKETKVVQEDLLSEVKGLGSSSRAPAVEQIKDRQDQPTNSNNLKTISSVLPLQVFGLADLPGTEQLLSHKNCEAISVSKQ